MTKQLLVLHDESIFLYLKVNFAQVPPIVDLRGPKPAAIITGCGQAIQSLAVDSQGNSTIGAGKSVGKAEAQSNHTPINDPANLVPFTVKLNVIFMLWECLLCYDITIIFILKKDILSSEAYGLLRCGLPSKLHNYIWLSAHCQHRHRVLRKVLGKDFKVKISPSVWSLLNSISPSQTLRDKRVCVR